MRNLIITLVLGSFLVGCVFASQKAEAPKKQSSKSVEKKKEIKLEFVDVPVYRISEKNTVYGDVISHSKREPYISDNARNTSAHETGHFIHSELRNDYTAKLKKRVNGFYCLEGKGVIVDEPDVKIQQVPEFIPESLRSFRYNLYFVQQLRDWNDTPLYVFDEWNAYVIGGMTSVDDVNKGIFTDRQSDAVSGCMDFSIYAIALGMTVQKYDPEYWKTNDQFKLFLKFNLKRANETFLVGRKMNNFIQTKEQEKLFKELVEGAGGGKMRAFLKTELDSVWLDEKTLKASTEQVKRVQLFPLRNVIPAILQRK